MNNKVLSHISGHALLAKKFINELLLIEMFHISYFNKIIRLHKIA